MEAERPPGSFPFLPELGSRLHLLPRAAGSAREALAKEYVAEALADETDLRVERVTLTPREDGALLQVVLRQGERALTAEMEV